MKAIIMLAALLAASAASAAKLPKGVSIHDGDSLRLTIRVANADTPELNGRCAAETRLARQAREFTADWMARHAGKVEVRASKVDRYGRVVARVSAGGQDLGEALIDAGLARPWRGRREPWC